MAGPLQATLSTHRAAEAAPGSWLCQNLVAKLKNVVEGIFILQIFANLSGDAGSDELHREIWAGSKGT